MLRSGFGLAKVGSCCISDLVGIVEPAESQARKFRRPTPAPFFSTL
jgi:hypothetical protein